MTTSTTPTAAVEFVRQNELVRELEHRLHISASTAHRLLRDPRFPQPFRLDGRRLVLYRRHAVDEFLAAGK